MYTRRMPLDIADCKCGYKGEKCESVNLCARVVFKSSNVQTTLTVRATSMGRFYMGRSTDSHEFQNTEENLMESHEATLKINCNKKYKVSSLIFRRTVGSRETSGFL